MSERIYKLQPNRTIQLRGFDDLGAAAALHSATAGSFKVSGVFRDPGDFAVLVLYDADNFYEHPRLKHLPDTDFSGLRLQFDVRYAGLAPLDSPKYATIDWPYLDVIRPDGSAAKIPLIEHAVQAGGTYACAHGSFVIEDNRLQPYDRLTVWYQNFAFDYTVPNEPGNLPAAADVAAALAAQINGVNWQAYGTLIPLRAEAEGGALHIYATRPGADGNMICMYAVAKNDRLRTTSEVAAFSGGSSDAVWRIMLDFSALEIPAVRQMWLTFAPALAGGEPFIDTEWEAEFTNWSLSGPEERRALKVAGPGSVRVEEDSSWCEYTGDWSVETGWYSGGFARRASAVGDTVTVRYLCAHEHDLYVGTSLYSDRGIAGVRLDGDAETELDCRLNVEPAVVTRRKVRAAVPAGEHIAAIRWKSGGCVYFDFLEAAAPSDVPEPLPALARICPALDYSTDHTYKLPPARILWMLDQLGYAGPLNEYIGVFWWNQRKRVNAVIPAVEVTFGGQFEPGDQVFLSIGGQTCGKTVFPNETTAVMARHFAFFINETFVGVWAAAAGNVLTITARSPRPAYSFAFQAWKESTAGELAWTGTLEGAEAGQWEVDPAQTPVLNRGARDWHKDLFRECSRRGREVTVAASMELVNPPAGFAARYAGGSPVETSVGFGNLLSTHCAFSSPMLNFQKRLYLELAELMDQAGLAPNLQFGEFCWWYFAQQEQGGAVSMAYYDDETKAAAEAQLGRPLHVFISPSDDAAYNGYADAGFLRERLRAHVAAIANHVRAAYPPARLEVLFPYDVNHPVAAGVHQLGGPLNRYVNLPTAWENKASSGVDGLKIEALDFGAWSRDLGLSCGAIAFGLSLAWPRENLRHLLPVFQPGYAWQKECLAALGEGISAVTLWAFDHVCLFGLDPDPSGSPATARRQG